MVEIKILVAMPPSQIPTEGGILQRETFFPLALFLFLFLHCVVFLFFSVGFSCVCACG